MSSAAAAAAAAAAAHHTHAERVPGSPSRRWHDATDRDDDRRRRRVPRSTGGRSEEKGDASRNWRRCAGPEDDDDRRRRRRRDRLRRREYGGGGDDEEDGRLRESETEEGDDGQRKRRRRRREDQAGEGSRDRRRRDDREGRRRMKPSRTLRENDDWRLPSDADVVSSSSWTAVVTTAPPILADPRYLHIVRPTTGGRPCNEGGEMATAAMEDACQQNYPEVTRAVLRPLLDAMAMEIVGDEDEDGGDGKPGGLHNWRAMDAATITTTRVRPMDATKRKPVETPGSVRDFALLQVSLASAAASTEGAAHALKSVAFAFRIAAHFCLRFHASSLTSVAGGDGSRAARRAGDALRRSFMVLFVALRGLLVRLAEKVDDDAASNEGGALGLGSKSHWLQNFFASYRPCDGNFAREEDEGARSQAKTGSEDDPSFTFSEAEQLLLDVVPLLTDFVRPPLGEKHAVPFLQNLLKLDGNAVRNKKQRRQGGGNETNREGAGKTMTTTSVVRDGLMECFVRRLSGQERWDSCRLQKEMGIPPTSDNVSYGGASASLLPEPSPECCRASELVNGFRRWQLDIIQQTEEAQNERERDRERDREREAWDNDGAKAMPDLVSRRKKRPRSPSPFSNDKFLGDNDDASEAEDLRLLRMDGCIYLLHIEIAWMKVSHGVTNRLSSSPTPPKEAREIEGRGDFKESKRNSESRTEPLAEKRSDSSPGELRNKVNRKDSSRSDSILADSGGVRSKSCTPSKKAKSKEDAIHLQRQKLCLTAYFLFHTLVENAASNGNKGSKRITRESLTSAVLACLLLAGKMEDCPVKVKTLLGLTERIPLPPRPMSDIASQGVEEHRSEGCASVDDSSGGKRRKCNVSGSPFDKKAQSPTSVDNRDSASSSPSHGEKEWGQPSSDLIKHYELCLLCIFGFNLPHDTASLHPTTYLDSLRSRLELDDSQVDAVLSVLLDPCYTHSALCLLQEPSLIVAAAYHFGCTKLKQKMHTNWAACMGEDAASVKVLSDHMWEVYACTRTRNSQWRDLKRWRDRYFARKNSVSAPDATSETKEVALENESSSSTMECPSPPFISPPRFPTDLTDVVENLNKALQDVAGVDFKTAVVDTIKEDNHDVKSNDMHADVDNKVEMPATKGNFARAEQATDVSGISSAGASAQEKTTMGSRHCPNITTSIASSSGFGDGKLPCIKSGKVVPSILADSQQLEDLSVSHLDKPGDYLGKHDKLQGEVQKTTDFGSSFVNIMEEKTGYPGSDTHGNERSVSINHDGGKNSEKLSAEERQSRVDLGERDGLPYSSKEQDVMNDQLNHSTKSSKVHNGLSSQQCDGIKGLNASKVEAATCSINKPLTAKEGDSDNWRKEASNKKIWSDTSSAASTTRDSAEMSHRARHVLDPAVQSEEELVASTKVLSTNRSYPNPDMLPNQLGEGHHQAPLDSRCSNIESRRTANSSHVEVEVETAGAAVQEIAHGEHSGGKNKKCTVPGAQSTAQQKVFATKENFTKRCRQTDSTHVHLDTLLWRGHRESIQNVILDHLGMHGMSDNLQRRESQSGDIMSRNVNGCQPRSKCSTNESIALGGDRALRPLRAERKRQGETPKEFLPKIHGKD